MIDPLLLAANEYSPMQIMVRLAVVVLLAVLLVVVWLVIRRKLTRQDDTPPLGFTLKDLREMRAAGQLSDEELARAEAKALAKSRSHYLGDNADAEEQASVDEDAGRDAGRDPGGSAGPGPGGTENPGLPPDKNG